MEALRQFFAQAPAKGGGNLRHSCVLRGTEQHHAGYPAASFEGRIGHYLDRRLQHVPKDVTDRPVPFFKIQAKARRSALLIEHERFFIKLCLAAEGGIEAGRRET